MKSDKIVGLFTGRAKEIGENKLISAIDKDRVDSLVVYKDAIEGDEVVNLKHHGGLDRVIHHYSLEQYNYLKAELPEHKDLFIAGSYGENVTTETLCEEDLCIGDIFQVGNVKLQLTEGRKPCGTIDANYGVRGVLKEIIKSGRYGWFYKVLNEGEIQTTDEFTLIERAYPELNLKKAIIEIFQKKDKDKEFLIQLNKCPALSTRWKTLIDKLLI